MSPEPTGAVLIRRGMPAVTLTSSPLSMVKVLGRYMEKTVPTWTWYWRMRITVSFMLGCKSMSKTSEPIASKTASIGAKTVKAALSSRKTGSKLVEIRS